MNAKLTSIPRGVKLILGGLLIVLLAVAGFLWKKSRGETLSYREGRVEKRDLILKILTTGSVQPENRLEIKAPISGRMEDVLLKEGQKVRKGQILAWMSSSERAALLDSARSQGAEEVKKWQELYRPTPIVAPITGTLILRNIEPGQTFTTSDAILVMSDRLTVKAQFDETDIAQIKLQQSADIVLDAYAGKKIPGTIDQIAFEAKTVNNVTTYVVDVLPVEAPEFMRSGMTANVSVVVDSKIQVIAVPNEFLQKQEGENKVLVRDPARDKGEAPIEKSVQLGISDGKFTEILGGLAENDIVLRVQLENSDDKSKANANPFSPFRGGGNRNRNRNAH